MTKRDKMDEAFEYLNQYTEQVTNENHKLLTELLDLKEAIAQYLGLRDVEADQVPTTKELTLIVTLLDKEWGIDP